MKKVLIVLIAIIGFVSCSSDDGEQQPVSQSHIVEFTTETIYPWESVGLTTILTFEDDTQLTINSEFDYTQNIVSVEIE